MYLKIRHYFNMLFRFLQIKIILAQWFEATGRINWTPKTSSVICEKHFEYPSLSLIQP